MVKIKIGEKKDTEQPILSLNMAKLKMTQVEWQGEPQEISRKEGRGTFVSPPHLNALIEVVDDYGDGSADGEKFWEKFRLSQVDGVDDELSSDAWEGRPGTKFAACMESKYGPKFWANGGEFEPEDFEGWEFNAGVMPRTPPGGGSPVGSQVDYKSMHAIPKPKKKKKQPKKEESGQAGDDLDFTDEELDQMEEALG
jgi:hypothetical protein